MLLLVLKKILLTVLHARSGRHLWRLERLSPRRLHSILAFDRGTMSSNGRLVWSVPDVFEILTTAVALLPKLFVELSSLTSLVQNFSA